MANFPLSYRLSWLPRLLKPSLEGIPGDAQGWFETAAPPPPASVRLIFLGDMSAVANASPPEIDRSLRATLASADLVVANCESPVVERPTHPLPTRLGLRHAMTPEFLDAVLAAGSISPERLLLSLANNHALDQGVAGFEETLAALSSRGIRTIGTPEHGPVRKVSTAGLTLGFLAFTAWRNAEENEFAGRVSMPADIAGWQGEAAGVDLLCAVPHWDWEFRHFPRSATRALARRLVEDGAGLIAGHHAHVLQAAETIAGVPVAYGLGDFLGTALPRQPLSGRVGAMLVVDIGLEPAGGIVARQLVPFLRLRQKRNERLVPLDLAEGAVAAKTRSRLAAIFGRPAGGQALRETL